MDLAFVDLKAWFLQSANGKPPPKFQTNPNRPLEGTDGSPSSHGPEADVEHVRQLKQLAAPGPGHVSQYINSYTITQRSCSYHLIWFDSAARPYSNRMLAPAAANRYFMAIMPLESDRALVGH